MSFLDYVVIGALAVWFVLSAIYLRKNKKQNKCPGCSGSCSSCPKNADKNDKKQR